MKQVTTTDGTSVTFITKTRVVTGPREVFFSPDKSLAVVLYRQPLETSVRDFLIKLTTKYRDLVLNQDDGGDYFKDFFCWPQHVFDYEGGRLGLVFPFFKPRFIFGEDTNLAGGAKTATWFISAKNFNLFVPNKDRGNLLGYLRAGLHLCQALRRLHKAGLIHSDLSGRNCLVDPVGGEVCLINIDYLIGSELSAQSSGLGTFTPDFAAPEIISSCFSADNFDRRGLNQASNYHSLAVLIYGLLLHRHPLRGSKIHSADLSENEAMLLGSKALFIENPDNNSNRLLFSADDKDNMPWFDTATISVSVLGPHLKSLFAYAFIDGLKDPKLRPTADEWEKALVKTVDLLQPCGNPKCSMKWYVFQKPPKSVCPYCGEKFQGKMLVLDFYSTVDEKKYTSDNHQLVVSNNKYIYPWHADASIFPNEFLDSQKRKPVGYFSYDQKKGWYFVNQTLESMEKVFESNQKEKVGPGEAIKIFDEQKLILKTGPSGRLVQVRTVSF
ncbi:MAG: kinase [Deltaproteobacteria bacterium]|jgi:serine/threonine protein kinase|nr:kinase [Deltaproteobacteria bacterium]